MTKARLVEHLHRHVGLTKKEAGEVVVDVFDILCDTLVAGDKVKISGFGQWSVSDKSARKGRNPQTNESIVIARRRVLSWKTSPVLRSQLNEDG
ncbi:MAG: integration host factor subunit alpha [Alphaproteobacteria bacterium]|nr:integration host factor subunit alpha [Alphaproteobacteria bacterium]